MNRIVEGHGIVAPADSGAANGRRLADIGYAGLAGMLTGGSG